MNEELSIYLFDLDGVLIQPGGYRRALRDTINDWAGRMGITHDVAPNEEDIALLEAQGVTSEWDMIPFSLALTIESWWNSHPEIMLPEDLNQAISVMSQASRNEVPRPRYNWAFKELGNQRVSGYPLVEGLGLKREEEWMKERFPRLSRHPLLDTLFSSTRDILRHLPNRDFQVRVLGSEIFESTYQMAAPFMTHSYLATWDRPLVEKGLLTEVFKRGNSWGAVITARPSRSPLPSPNRLVGYSPEAEIAVGLIELDGIPVVGHGALTYIAEHLEIHAEQLLKPSPFQALAAIMAALSGDALIGLLWAYQVYAKPSWGTNSYLDLLVDKYRSRFPQLPSGLTVHVFEDSPIGIQASRRSTQFLGKLGCWVDLHAWGISRQPAKIQALVEQGAQVFPDVNQALEAVLARQNHRKRAPVEEVDST
ncbi:hypothetical protein [Thermanaerothrix sp.]|uniref:hypothetical protein n=1 Tax=Thermanaerothrix sp. TaxID=2972675 RepID=UPI003C7E320C